MLGLRPEDVEDLATALGVDLEARLVEGRVDELSDALGVRLLDSRLEGEERREDDIDDRFDLGNPSENPES
jgi:hypothetical protein